MLGIAKKRSVIMVCWCLAIREILSVRGGLAVSDQILHPPTTQSFTTRSVILLVMLLATDTNDHMAWTTLRDCV